ncbi:hypothetical protein [Bradyrhizobium guangdongense]|uniref:Uncharacterized protein n=1 Tax=Bradyrhizobium guangdongense TaxID=1325090 RepID=A0A410V7G0_9BRAD|nr:hypothetical protein [Bradyrhizobium guangdongense]QAU39594.1 hypothetical protein X265_19445 [Bradyrhizobium guangdongense]QOZ60655.1 hypothetical protein XH86_19455 [Bradyrhizobium guangdongense]GGI24145.1 hypothetical protein GCM10010987_27920 [Bradyrhizobium guangdongense]
MSIESDGFKVLEQAALTMLDAVDEEAVIEFYREQLERALRANLGDDRGKSSSLADQFVEIIRSRRLEIERARGSNPTGVQ